MCLKIDETSFQWELGPKVNQRTVKPGPLRRGAVIGAGTMGTGITMSMLNAGIPVILVEQSQEVKLIMLILNYASPMNVSSIFNGFFNRDTCAQFRRFPLFFNRNDTFSHLVRSLNLYTPF